MCKPIEIIARCTKCGRGFVWLNSNSDMIDRYGVTEECGGKIEKLEVKNDVAL
jgi:DNA-directed RNA polymerase subunit RPC12/RpoP